MGSGGNSEPPRVGATAGSQAPRPAAGAGGAGERKAEIVVWFSRHDPLPCELAALEAKLGPVAILQVPYVRDVNHAVEVIRASKARYAVAVLPMTIIARLAELQEEVGFTLLYARMEQFAYVTGRRPVPGRDYDPQCEVAIEAIKGWRLYRFVRFERVVRVELVTEPW